MTPAHIIALFSLMWLNGGIPKHPGAEELMVAGATALMKEDYARAIPLYGAALRAGLEQPEYSARVHYGRGIAYQNTGESAKAAADYAEAIRIKPEFAEPHNNLALLYNAQGEYDKAVAEYTEALRINSDAPDTLFGRGCSHHLKGDYDHAIEDYSTAIGINPDFAGAYSNRAMAYLAKGDHDKALEDYWKCAWINQKIIDTNPDFTPRPAGANPGNDADNTGPDVITIYNNQAWLFATCPEEKLRNGVRALEYARKACELCEWKRPGHIDSLAAAFAETGDFDSAVKFQAWYVTLAPDDKGGKERLELYKNHKPYREMKP